MSDKKLIKKIKFELNQIENLLSKYKDLINKCEDEKPDLIELTALASVLHSFYSGVENIFSLIAKNIDNNSPEGENWHKELLIQMQKENDERNKVISENIKDDLVELLAFRHFYRHSYSFSLDWKEMKDIVLNLFETWERVQKDINKFIESLE